MLAAGARPLHAREDRRDRRRVTRNSTGLTRGRSRPPSALAQSSLGVDQDLSDGLFDDRTLNRLAGSVLLDQALDRLGDALAPPFDERLGAELCARISSS
jgi:hypothetical protein